jgi:RNA polymerase sigma-70 factor (ECF subfamily)
VTDAELAAAFDLHRDAVYRFAWRMTGSADAADDITQDVFLSVLRHPGRFDPLRGALRAFLIGIARNLALKRWRDEHRWEDLDDEDGGLPLEVQLKPDVMLTLERSEIAAIVGQAIHALPPLQREALILVEYEEMSLQDVAKTVESEIGTVKSRLHRARENLRRALAPLKPANAMRSTTHGTLG